MNGVSDVAAVSITSTTASDWEILDDLNTPTQLPPISHGESADFNTGTTMVHTSISDFVVLDDTDEICNVENTSLFSVRNNRNLRHSVSSPILSGRTNDASLTGMSRNDEIMPSLNAQDDLDDSFSVISDIPSVCTIASTAKSTMTVSFRDAIMLSSPTTEHTTTSYRTMALSSHQTKETSTTSPRQQIQQTSKPRQRSRIQPKFTVVQCTTPIKQIRRCSKSAGDLFALNLSEEMDQDKSLSYSGVCTDRLYDDEVYYRKAIGATSRANGMKLRPDEAQRREMIIQKKDRQRQATNGPKIKK
jgi:hypothetical protein